MISETSTALADLAKRGQPIDAAIQNAQRGGARDDQALWETAKAFETAFLAEMLKHAKVAEMDTEFSGGHGEEAFRSFLVDEYAAALSDSGDFGLAERLYADMKSKVSAHDE